MSNFRRVTYGVLGGMLIGMVVLHFTKHQVYYGVLDVVLAIISIGFGLS